MIGLFAEGVVGDAKEIGGELHEWRGDLLLACDVGGGFCHVRNRGVSARNAIEVGSAELGQDESGGSSRRPMCSFAM